MATWKVQSSDGRSWTIEAPDNIPQAEVIAFADENADSWVDGGRYRLTEEGQEAPAATPAPTATPTPAPASVPGFTSTPRNQEVQAAVDSLSEQIKELESAISEAPTREFNETPGGAATGMASIPAARDLQRAALAKLESLKAQRDKLTLGTTGQTVGGVGGALAGTGAGIALGSPFGPPGMVVGGILGSILGGAGGAALGTKLKDIPEAREIMDISDAEAAALIRSRAIESLVWDGAFVLLLGPGGRAIGKMVNGQKLLPALKAAAKESFAWEDILRSKKAQTGKVVEQRAAQAPTGLATQASDAIGAPRQMTDREASESLIGDIARRTQGHVPTTGEMRGFIGGGEALARRQSPKPFFVNDKMLAQTADDIRHVALNSLDNAGAYPSTETAFGEAVARVRQSASATLKSTTGPIFERASQSNVMVDMREPLKYLDNVLFRDTESAQSLLSSGERQRLTILRDLLKEEPFLSPQGAQDFISGQKAALRGLATDGAKPGEFMQKVLNDLVGQADNAYLTELRTVDDPVLVRDLLGARKLYRDTMADLYSDTMATLAGKNPEDMGRALTTKGSVTEIREMRRALDRAVMNAPGKPRVQYGPSMKVREMSKEMLDTERGRIDAGLIKGFIEQHTRSLTDLEGKLTDPGFRATLRELLVGDGVANPVLGKKVLGELDRVLGVMKLIKPEMAPQPGRIAMPGVGNVGAGTLMTAGTGDIRTAAPLVVFTLGMSRVIGNIVAKAMTTGNLGTIRTLQRAMALVPAAGKNAAAAEALLGALRELDGWDRANGGAGLEGLGIPDQPVEK